MPTYYNKLTVVDGNSTIREIDLSQDTVSSAADIAAGKYGHINTGERVLGTGQGGGTLVQKTITLNGTYDPDDDSADGYSEVTVNVQGGASMTEVANTYGTELVITSAPGSAPSATRHTLYFEYTDSTNETVYAYYDDPLIGPAITATTPTTHNNKTVTLAQLDGTTWYSYTPQTETWETLYNNNATQYSPDPTESYPYCWISDLSGVYPTAGSEWRITFNGTTYRCTAVVISNVPIIGNPKFASGTDDGSNVPFAFANQGWGAWSGQADLPNTDQTVPVKIERLVS